MALVFYVFLALFLLLDVRSTFLEPSTVGTRDGAVVPAATIMCKVGVASLSPRPSPFPRRRFSIFAVLLIAGVERNPGPPSVNYGLLNTRSAVNKAAVLHDMVTSNDLSFCFFTETWFKRSD